MIISPIIDKEIVKNFKMLEERISQHIFLSILSNIDSSAQVTVAVIVDSHGSTTSGDSQLAYPSGSGPNVTKRFKNNICHIRKFISNFIK